MDGYWTSKEEGRGDGRSYNRYHTKVFVIISMVGDILWRTSFILLFAAL